MNVWFPNKESLVEKVIPALEQEATLPMPADRTEQEKLVELSEKLSTHNETHGKNVVFWSCKRCNPDAVKPL